VSSMMGLFKDYKMVAGGISIGVMLLSSALMWVHPPTQKPELIGACRLWSVYLVIGAALTTVILVGYAQSM
jgi:hypothetical protein